MSFATSTDGEVSEITTSLSDRDHARSDADARRARRSPLAGRGDDLPSRVAVVAVLVALGVANIAMRARWHEVEDGVLWGARAEGVTAVEVAPRIGRRDAPASSRATCCSRSTARRSRRRRTSSSTSTRSREGTRLAYTLLRLGTQQALARLAGARAARRLDVLRARRGRPLHAARRRVGAAAPSARSGDAALLLAVRRVLRRVHLLVQRPVRSARLGLLLGRRGRDGAAAAAAAALHAGLPRAAGAVRAAAPARRARCR